MINATAEAPAVNTARTDIFGKHIQPGDQLVYATRRGSSTFLNKLFVQEVTSAGGIKGFNPDDPTRRSRTIFNLSTVAKVA